MRCFGLSLSMAHCENRQGGSLGTSWYHSHTIETAEPTSGTARLVLSEASTGSGEFASQTVGREWRLHPCRKERQGRLGLRLRLVDQTASARLGQGAGQPVVPFFINPNPAVVISISCSRLSTTKPAGPGTGMIFSFLTPLEAEYLKHIEKLWSSFLRFSADKSHLVSTKSTSGSSTCRPPSPYGTSLAPSL